MWTTGDVQAELLRGFQENTVVFNRRAARFARWLAAHNAEVRAQAMKDAARRCTCGHVFAEHLTPGTECTATPTMDDYCTCGRFRRQTRSEAIE